MENEANNFITMKNHLCLISPWQKKSAIEYQEDKFREKTSGLKEKTDIVRLEEQVLYLTPGDVLTYKYSRNIDLRNIFGKSVDEDEPVHKKKTDKLTETTTESNDSQKETNQKPSSLF